MHIARTALVTLASPLLFIGSVAQLPSSADSSTPAALAVPTDEFHIPVKLAPNEMDVVGWARDRFTLVGLDLPAVEVSFHDDAEACKGAQGIYRNDGGHRVHVCIPDHGTFASNLQRRRTLVHELAHAWEQANLDDAGRQALLGILDADHWYGPEAAWEERGAERFAETIVWGLYDQPRRPTLIDVPCHELHADFRAITGHPAPGPISGLCSVDEE